jgi:hypothetical protein
MASNPTISILVQQLGYTFPLLLACLSGFVLAAFTWARSKPAALLAMGAALLLVASRLGMVGIQLAITSAGNNGHGMAEYGRMMSMLNLGVRV